MLSDVRGIVVLYIGFEELEVVRRGEGNENGTNERKQNVRW